jgi:hypothetical protein
VGEITLQKIRRLPPPTLPLVLKFDDFTLLSYSFTP